MAVSESQQRSGIRLREVGRLRRSVGRAERFEPPGAAGKQETVLEELPLGQLEQAERQGNDRRVESPGQEVSDEILTRRLHHVELDAGRGVLETVQEAGQEIRRECGEDAHGEAQRTLLEPLPHGLQEERLVEDPERLFVRLAAQPRELDAATLALHHGPAQRGLELADLERERGLRNMHALCRPAERSVFDQGLEIAQLTQCDWHGSLLRRRRLLTRRRSLPPVLPGRSRSPRGFRRSPGSRHFLPAHFGFSLREAFADGMPLEVFLWFLAPNNHKN